MSEIHPPTYNIRFSAVKVPISYSDMQWEYWMRVDSWSLLEATLILDGVPPGGYELNDRGYFSETQAPLVEPDTETIRDLLSRKFGKTKNRINPKECLEWALKSNITLNPLALETAITCGLISKPSQPASAFSKPEERNNSGRHFAEMRLKILGYALKLLSSPPEGFELFHKKDRRINITQLRDAIVDHGHELVWENGKQVGGDMIYDTLQTAIKGKFLSDKTGD